MGWFDKNWIQNIKESVVQGMTFTPRLYLGVGLIVKDLSKEKLEKHSESYRNTQLYKNELRDKKTTENADRWIKSIELDYDTANLLGITLDLATLLNNVRGRGREFNGYDPGQITQRSEPLGENSYKKGLLYQNKFDNAAWYDPRQVWWLALANWNKDSYNNKTLIDLLGKTPVGYSPLWMGGEAVGNLTSKEGVAKTYNLASEGKLFDAGWSGVGDALNVVMAASPFGKSGRLLLNKQVLENLKKTGFEKNLKLFEDAFQLLGNYIPKQLPFTSIRFNPTAAPSDGLLSFFERTPSRISETERLGLPKDVRTNIESSNPTGENLSTYYNLLDRVQTLADTRRKLASKPLGIDETIRSNNRNILLEDSHIDRGSFYQTYPYVTERFFKTSGNVGFGRLGVGNGHSYGLNLGGVATRVKDLNPKEVVVFGDPTDKLGTVITANDLKYTKKGVRDVVQGMKDMESGAEFSGDAEFSTPAEALAGWLGVSKRYPSLRRTAMQNALNVLKENSGISYGKRSVYDGLRDIITENATMSPDAYSFFMRTAKTNPDKFHISYGAGSAGNFNSYARHPLNAPMYELEQNYLNGLIPLKLYVEEFNKWGEGLGLRKAYFKDGLLYKPQPYLVRNKKGGKILKGDKEMKIGKVKKLQSKYDAAWADGDARHSNSGNTPKITRALRLNIIDNITKYPASELKKFTGFMKRIAKHEESGNSTALKLSKKELNDFLDNIGNTYGHYKSGGIIKALEGTKSTWQKVGDFLNSDAGKGILSGLSSIATTAIQNKKVGSAADVSKSSIDMLTEEQIRQSKMQRKQEGLNLLLNTIDPDNPNANGGIFQDYFLNLYMNQDLLAIKLAGENQKAMIDAQALLMKSDNLTSSIGGIVQNGLGALGTYLGNKKNSSTNISSTSAYKIDDFWSNPTYENYLKSKGVMNQFAPKYSFNIKLAATS